MLKKVNTVVILSAASLIVLWGAQPARATFELTLQSFNSSGTSLGKVTIDDGGVLDSDSDAGIISYSGAAGGGFNINVTSGISKPILGNADSAVMDLSSLNVNLNKSAWTAGNYLTITLSDQGFTLPTATADTFTSTVSATAVQGGGTIGFSSYVDSNDGLNTTSGSGVTSLTDSGTLSYVNTETTGINPGLTSFSMTSITIWTPSSFDSSVSMDNTTTLATPAPSGLLLASSSLPIFGLGLWLRRRPARAAVAA